jgi:fluoride ion exporter CrcB/FEX
VLRLLLGLGVARAWPHWLATGVQTGVIGAYMTYSTWAVDSLSLAREGAPRLAMVNLAGSLLAGVLLAWVAVSLGSVL